MGALQCIVDDVLHVVTENNISALSLRNEMNCRQCGNWNHAKGKRRGIKEGEHAWWFVCFIGALHMKGKHFTFNWVHTKNNNNKKIMLDKDSAWFPPSHQFRTGQMGSLGGPSAALLQHRQRSCFFFFLPKWHAPRPEPASGHRASPPASQQQLQPI